MVKELDDNLYLKASKINCIFKISLNFFLNKKYPNVKKMIEHVEINLQIDIRIELRTNRSLAIQIIHSLIETLPME